MIQAIFFDFNGVIINDEPLQLKAYQEALSEQGIELTAEQYYSALGMDDRAFVRAAYARAHKELAADSMQSVIGRKSAVQRSLIADELPLFPGVVTFLKQLRRRYSLGLVSMARRVEIDYVLERSGLGSLFAVVVSAEAVSAHKPDPECYRLGLASLNEKRREGRHLPLLPAECLVIEDAPPGIEAGRGAGMRTLGVTNTVSENSLRAAGAEVVTVSLEDWTADALHLVFFDRR
jgi:HAD superfamily hydrolase (TIGR01509 family)